MEKSRELPTYTLLNPEFHTLEDVLSKGEYTQEKSEEVTNKDENWQG